MEDSAKSGVMEKGMAGSSLGGNSDCLCKQPSVQVTTKQVEGVGRVTPTDSSGSWMRKHDPTQRGEEVAWPEATHMVFLN